MALDPSSGWSYYKEIQISDTANVSADYQMKLKVYSGNGDDNTADGIIYCDNHCEDFPNDIRFGTTNDPSTATQLAQWIEESDATSATIWVKLPSDGSDIIYMFVGNSSASQYSNGDDTFLFFDDFEGTSLDTSKWTVSGSVSVSNSEVILNPGSEIVSTSTFQYKALRAKWKYRNIQYYGVSYVAFRNGDANLPLVETEAYGRETYYRHFTRDGTTLNTVYSDLAHDSSYHIIDIIWASSTKAKFYIDDGHYKESTQNIPTTNLPVMAFARGGSGKNVTTILDWILVRKYADPEPTWSSFGSWTEISAVQTHEKDYSTSALLKARLSKSIIFSVLAQKQFKSEFNSDATLIFRWLKGLTASSQLKKTQALISSISALLEIAKSLSTNFDSLTILRQLLSHELDADLKKTQELLHELSALLRSTKQLSSDFSALIGAYGIKNVEIDTLLSGLQKLTTTVDSLLSKLRKAESNINAFISRRLELTSSVDTLLRSISRASTKQSTIIKQVSENLTIFIPAIRRELYVWCSKWDEDDWSIRLEFIANKPTRDIIIGNITPGAVSELYNILGEPKFIDTTYSSGNTLIIAPVSGTGLAQLREKTKVAVKGYTETMLTPDTFLVKMDLVKL